MQIQRVSDVHQETGGRHARRILLLCRIKMLHGRCSDPLTHVSLLEKFNDRYRELLRLDAYWMSLELSWAYQVVGYYERILPAAFYL